MKKKSNLVKDWRLMKKKYQDAAAAAVALLPGQPLLLPPLFHLAHVLLALALERLPARHLPRQRLQELLSPREREFVIDNLLVQIHFKGS